MFVDQFIRPLPRPGAAATSVIACLGLLGLAAFMAERRRKEIGIRKAMDARSGDVVGPLLWQFAKPMLAANLIAWPVAYFAMRHWPDGFVYRVELEWWMFVAGCRCSGARHRLGAVLVQSYLAAHGRPVAALRYE